MAEDVTDRIQRESRIVDTIKTVLSTERIVSADEELYSCIAGRKRQNSSLEKSLELSGPSFPLYIFRRWSRIG